MARTSAAPSRTPFAVKSRIPGRETAPQPPVKSPDDKWEASISNYNLVVRPIESHEPIVLSTDGSEGNYYNARTIVRAARIKAGILEQHGRDKFNPIGKMN